MAVCKLTRTQPAFPVLEVILNSTCRYDDPDGQEDEEFLPNAEGKKPVRFTDVGAETDWGGKRVTPGQNQTDFMFSV